MSLFFFFFVPVSHLLILNTFPRNYQRNNSVLFFLLENNFLLLYLVESFVKIQSSGLRILVWNTRHFGFLQILQIPPSDMDMYLL